MADHNPDSITRWAIRRSYGIRNPTPDQVARYRYWHAVSRGPGGFAESGPWERWLSKPIPPDAVAPRRASRGAVRGGFRGD